MGSIIVANSNIDSAKRIAAVLKTAGLPAFAICTTGAQLMNLTNRNYRGGVIICGCKLLDMTASDLATYIGSNYEFLIILQRQVHFSGESAIPSLTMPISRVNLIATVEMLLKISEGSSLNRRKRLEIKDVNEEKLIKKAKMLLIEHCNFTESAAHRFLQKKSMSSGRKIGETALIILETMDAAF